MSLLYTVRDVNSWKISFPDLNDPNPGISCPHLNEPNPGYDVVSISTSTE